MSGKWPSRPGGKGRGSGNTWGAVLLASYKAIRWTKCPTLVLYRRQRCRQKASPAPDSSLKAASPHPFCGFLKCPFENYQNVSQPCLRNSWEFYLPHSICVPATVYSEFCLLVWLYFSKANNLEPNANVIILGLQNCLARWYEGLYCPAYCFQYA